MILTSFLLIWSLCHNFSQTGGTQYSPKTSWKNQNLSSVPLDLGVELRRLDLSSNFIKQLHILPLPHLEQLDLSSNQLDFISEEAFEKLARLRLLNLSRNELNIHFIGNSKALQSLGRLRSLDISMNGLGNDEVELYLRNKSRLCFLKMSSNALMSLSHRLFEESKTLKEIIMDNNLISEIAKGTFEPLSQLETLVLAKNNLRRICDFKLHQVKYLDLSQNSLEFFVAREDNQLYSLETLDLSHNKLQYFPIVPKLNRLRYLHLQNNLIGTLHSEALMVSEVNSLYSEIMQEGVHFKNSLHSNWRLMPLIYIDLSSNHFKAFPLETVNLLSTLEILNFSHNCLHDISWNIRNYFPGHVRQLSYHSLKYLNLRGNGLERIAPLFFKALERLETLDLDGNFVQPCALMENVTSLDSMQELNDTKSCVAFEHMPTLKHLSLRDNNIKVLEANVFSKTPLVSLNLAKNPHLVLHGKALEGCRKTIQSLTLSDSNMTSLSLPFLPALTQINISNNYLSQIPNSLVDSPLQSLDVRNNMLSTVNHSLVQNLSGNFTEVLVSGNQFNCCDSTWVTVSIQGRVRLPDINDTECFTPGGLFMMMEYLRNPLFYCFFDEKTQEVYFGQLLIMVLFFGALFAALIVISRKMCCSQQSFIV